MNNTFVLFIILEVTVKNSQFEISTHKSFHVDFFKIGCGCFVHEMCSDAKWTNAFNIYTQKSLNIPLLIIIRKFVFSYIVIFFKPATKTKYLTQCEKKMSTLQLILLCKVPRSIKVIATVIAKNINLILFFRQISVNTIKKWLNLNTRPQIKIINTNHIFWR